MNGRIRSNPDKIARFSKFLKPGALAQLRDSKISARSQRLTRRLFSQTSNPSLPSMLVPSIQIGDAECLEQLAKFSSPNYGPQRFGRKKLLAAKSSVYILGFSATSPVLDSGNSTVNVVNNDLLVH